jgi:hypothetical protein
MMRTCRNLLPGLLLACACCAQSVPVPAPAPAAAPAPQPLLRAQYQWGYVGADGQGKGDLNVLLDPATGRAVLELQGLGERLMLLEGDRAGGYRVQIPRRKVDASAPTLAAVPLPFFPQVGNVEALYRLLAQGDGAGVKVTKRDASGPVKMRYQGNDDRGREVMVWLTRTRWEQQKPG